MTKDPDLPLFQYPDRPGHRGVDTSIAAADAIEPRAATLRARVLEILQHHPAGLTADECAEIMGESILSIRPRVTELRVQGEIRATDQRRRNASGIMARVWAAS